MENSEGWDKLKTAKRIYTKRNSNTGLNGLLILDADF